MYYFQLKRLILSFRQLIEKEVWLILDAFFLLIVLPLCIFILGQAFILDLGVSMRNVIILAAIGYLILFSGKFLIKYWNATSSDGDRLNASAQIFSVSVTALAVILTLAVNRRDAYCLSKFDANVSFLEKVSKVSTLVRLEIGLPEMCWDTNGGVQFPRALTKDAQVKKHMYEESYRELLREKQELNAMLITARLSIETRKKFNEFAAANERLEYYCDGQKPEYHSEVWRNADEAYFNFLLAMSQEVNICD